MADGSYLTEIDVLKVKNKAEIFFVFMEYNFVVYNFVKWAVFVNFVGIFKEDNFLNCCIVNSVD